MITVLQLLCLAVPVYLGMSWHRHAKAERAQDAIDEVTLAERIAGLRATPRSI